MDIALSNYDILKLVNNKANIVLYPNIHNYKTIDEILEPYGAAFILFESKPKYGHWCLLFKQTPALLEFFNPYNGLPDASLKFINKEFAKETKQNIPYLSLLLLKSPYQLSYNEFDFQEHNPNIKTCGRHCVVRYWAKDLDLYKYKDLIYSLCKKANITPDELVTYLTN